MCRALTGLQCDVFKWAAGQPDYACMWSDAGLSVGCDEQGRIALFLDASLETALLSPCGVFACPALAPQMRTALVQLELYKF